MKLDNASFAYLNTQLLKTCDTKSSHNVSNQLGKVHGDIYFTLFTCSVLPEGRNMKCVKDVSLIDHDV